MGLAAVLPARSLGHSPRDRAGSRQQAPRYGDRGHATGARNEVRCGRSIAANAINAAFARWDLSHLHQFELADGRLIGYPDDSFAPDLIWLDHAKLKVTREVKPGDEFEYIFDLGDNWQHRCHVDSPKADPLEEYGTIPPAPVAIWGWGWIPDQYGRRSEHDDDEN